MPTFELEFDSAESDDAQRIRAAVERAIAAVERVHRLPNLVRPIPVRIVPTLLVPARYLAQPGGGEVQFHPTARVPAVTFLHEVGHVVDHLGTGGTTTAVMSDVLDGVLRGWWETVETSAAYRRLQLIRRTHDLVQDRLQANYLMQPSELFARSYAQYVAARSGDIEIYRELLQQDSPRTTSSDTLAWRWDEDDFTLIAYALAALIEETIWPRTSVP